ncbi:MAG: histidine kinase [Vicingaceae bacterium]|nr:histidine kinase [Vicingaceae bacterium]
MQITFRYTFVLFLVVFCFNVNAQVSYFDSLKTVISGVSEDKKIALIIAIPFDKMNSNTSTAIDIYGYGIDIAKNQKSENLTAQLYEKQSIAYYYKGDYDLAVQTSLNAINLYEGLKNRLKVGSVYASLGYQMKRRDLPRAFEYMRKGINQLEQINDQKALSAAYNNFGVLHEMESNIDSALFYYKKGLLIVEELADSIGIPYSLNNIAGAYVIEGNYKEAMSYYDRAFVIRKKRNDLNGLAENYSYYGDFYFKQELYKQAIIKYLAAEKITAKINYAYLQKIISQQLATCYLETNNYSKALYYQKQQVILNSKLLNESSNKTIAELETQFETQKKEKQILEQNLIIANKDLEIKQQSYFMYVLIAIGILIVVLGFFILKQIKFKQQKLIEANRLKDEIAKIKMQEKLNEERVRISRDLHDNIGAQLTFIISSIDNMSYFMKETNNELKDKLSELNEFSRNAIKELRVTINTLNKSK